MFEVTDTAKTELDKVFSSEKAADRQLVLYFQGFG